MIKFYGPVTCLVTRGAARDSNIAVERRKILNAVDAAAKSGVTIIQIREKHLSAKHLFELVSDAARLTAAADSWLLVNDRIDIALAAGADGVHLRADSIPVSAVRQRTPSAFIIGASTHSLDEVRSAQSEGADFVLFGPVLATPGKSAVGLNALRNVVEAVAPFPVIAIGGIGEDAVSSVLDTGAAGFAAIRFLHEQAGLESTRMLRETR